MQMTVKRTPPKPPEATFTVNMEMTERERDLLKKMFYYTTTIPHLLNQEGAIDMCAMYELRTLMGQIHKELTSI